MLVNLPAPKAGRGDEARAHGLKLLYVPRMTSGLDRPRRSFDRSRLYF